MLRDRDEGRMGARHLTAIEFGPLKLIAIALMFSRLTWAEGIILDNSYQPSVRFHLQAVANDVWSIVQGLFQSSPPLNLPISCHVNLAIPITQLDDWTHPKRIIIGLTPTGLFYAQFVYQLAHELGHVMMDPRRTNGVIETISTALSYEVLDKLTENWSFLVPIPDMRGYAPNFLKYREDDERDRLSRLPPDIRSAVNQHRWPQVRRYLELHKSQQDQLSQSEIELGRDIETLGAIALRSRPVPWHKFVGLAGCILPSVKAEPQYRIAPLPGSCLTGLSGSLCSIGRGCIGLAP